MTKQKTENEESAPDTLGEGEKPKPEVAPKAKAEKPPVVDSKPPTLSPLDGKAPLKTAEQWAEAKSTPAWLFRATRVGLQWPLGREMTEKDFDAGVAWAAHAPCR